MGGSESAAETRAYYEQLFLGQLQSIRAALQSIGRRYHLTPEQAEELSSDVHLKIIEDDYAVLRKFQWRSSLQTYLTVVVNRVYLDGLVKERGKWRPSAAARRHGCVAVTFERLISRDGLSFDEACGALEQMHRAQVDRQSLDHLAAIVRVRSARQYVSGDALDRIQSRSGDPSVPLLEAVRAAASERASRALAAEIAALSDEDRLLVRRRFFDGARLLDVARETAQAPTIVYRRLARLLAVLRRRLEQRGISPFDVAQLLQG